MIAGGLFGIIERRARNGDPAPRREGPTRAAYQRLEMDPLKSARIRKIVEKLKEYRPEKIFLFGAWARGDADALSDIDPVAIKLREENKLSRKLTLSG
jgi:hypothetical protein